MSTSIVENILSREEYLAACKSNDVSNYRERIFSELLISFEPLLFEEQLELLHGYLGTIFQKLVDATPVKVEVLERDGEDQTSTLEEKKETVLKGSFDSAFQNFKERVQILSNGISYNPTVTNNTLPPPYVTARL